MKNNKRFHLRALSIKTVISILLIAATVGAWGNSLWIHAKAELAQILIHHAWQKSLSTKQIIKPWPWADTWPVAKLTFPEYKKTFYVLNGAQGNSLAFGPGYMNESVAPEDSGAKIISAHRDTHFKVLNKIKQNDRIILIDKNNTPHHYTLSSTHIYNIEQDSLSIDFNQDQLTLITCYPFDAIMPGGPLRLVVRADKLISKK